MQEIDGKLSSEDQNNLLNLASADAEVAELRDHLWKTAGDEEIKKYLDNNPVKEQTERLLTRINKPKKKAKIILMGIASAAAAAGVILILFVNGIFRNEDTSSNRRLDLLAKGPSSNQIQLSLSSGTTYTLNGDTVIATAAGPLNVTSKTLSYDAKGSVAGQYATLTVPIGRDYSVVLPDGSRVQLNSASTIRFPLSFDGPLREITVTGEAYIKVKSDPAKPLFVKLPGSTVQVLGTEFNVNAYDSIAKISLVTGAVKVKSMGDSLILKPGYVSLSSPKGITMQQFDEYETLSWRTGQFVFRNAKFEDVCKVIPRYFGANVIFDNVQNGSKRFTGVLDRTQPLEVQLRGLEATGAISYKMTKDSIIHIRFE
ncbi:FecR family protein [Chitinophaga sp. YR627]|uniref:FecR family protein n=1 Tax=Chitinophaga sp. YR627 TaxID=1881041 RepID=UPI0015A6FE99|nr:FecR domain-containing protein [Chitinophaga sp. YR627]